MLETASMNLRKTTRRSATIGTLGTLIAIACPAYAGPLTGFDLQGGYDYAVIYQGGGANTVNINNGSGLLDLGIVGNVGVAGTGKVALSGPLIINGNIDFAAPLTTQYSVSGATTVNGVVSGNHPNVQTAMNYLNTLSATLAGSAGTPVNLVAGTTLNASAGVTDLMGNKVFNVTSMSLGNGIITVNGDGVHKVVINFSSVSNFHANQIVLAGGLTPDDVLWNFSGGSAATLSGGPTLDINSNFSLGSHPDNILKGVFLDPYGTISVVSTEIDGRVFGGDTHNMQLVSGEYIKAPTRLPDTGSIATLVAIGLGTLFVGRKKLVA